ncbi:primase-helicase zinc-binding domain-containing protein [Desulfovibrio ferrophilus]|uniref:P4 alpha zinc-binding domain-containing protein n=1 Tax=Desulfovibrio ferrophilus TaxID=241368 RepID=A0A2Z6AZ49_9BACT|nr:primase-helicase zinc-binding domain-containing protein [Desulfovibrio ferrophilus]BBD08470.1 P4 alpha zinc-binding domain-containing protein [Desulfovibrio ferrophilus]
MNVLELLQADGVSPRKVSGSKGGEHHSPCPGCGGTDRFHCWPEQNGGDGSWWCRGCDSGGDCIQYLVDFRHMDFRAAAAFVGRKLEPCAPRPLLPPRRLREASPWQPEPAREPSERWRTRANELVVAAHAELLRTSEALEFLARRGLPLEAVERYRLGWLSKDVYRERSAWGLPHEMNPRTGKPRKLWIPAGLVIPIFHDGQLHRVRVRRPKPGPFGPKKYCWVPGSGSGTMVLSPGARAFVAVEAELDAMLCDFATGDDVGALGLGTISAKPDAWTHGVLSQSLTILNALDFESFVPTDSSEKAQLEAERKVRQQRRVRDWWQVTYDHAERWPVPEAKDPGEAFAAGVSIADWIKAGLPPVMLMPAAPVRPAKPQPTPEVSAPALASPESKQPEQKTTSLAALERLLRETGIQLTFSGSQPFDIPKPLRGHTGILRRLKELCFQDDELGAYLDRHPAAIITADNLVVRI